MLKRTCVDMTEEKEATKAELQNFNYSFYVDSKLKLRRE
jgi:hypothetical protein